MLPLEQIRSLLMDGKPVLIFDSSSRENEVDMVFYAPKIDSHSITTLRKIAGGLICYSMPRKVGEAIGLKYMDELLRELGYGDLTGKVLGYGDPPNFSLWVNHKDVMTGIRDADRAKTIKELDKVVELVLDGQVKEAKSKFYSEFISPGHVPILLGRGLDVRRGHTELSLSLAELSGLRPSTVIAEMLDDSGALSKEDARKVAARIGTMLIDGSSIIEEWLARKQ